MDANGIVGFQDMGRHGKLIFELPPPAAHGLPTTVEPAFGPAILKRRLQSGNPLQQCFAARLFTHTGLPCRHGVVIRELFSVDPEKASFGPGRRSRSFEILDVADYACGFKIAAALA